MAKFELKLPKMGESVAEATITNWLKEVGDTIEADEAVLEIATDKVDSEVPSEVDGVLLEMLFNVDDIVKVGQTIAVIEIYSPLVRNIAKKEGIDQAELDAVLGSGKEGRVTKKDILNYIENRSAKPVAKQEDLKKPLAKVEATQANGISQSEPKTAVVSNGEDEIIEMTRMGKLIAKHMVDSVQTSAHVQSFIEADVTKIWNWRNKVKNDFQNREGEKLTFTPIFMEAVAKALRDFPMLNISLQNDTIVKKKNINLGMAAALADGNLIVPVIKNADQLNLVGMTKRVNDLADRARNNELKPDDIQDGTYTVTNVGFGKYQP